MPRIPLDHPRTVFVRLMEFYSGKKYGKVLDPGRAVAHNRRVLLTMVAHESMVARWRTLSPTHQALAVLAASAEIGCSWCVDFGYWEFHHRGVDPVKLRHIHEAPTVTVYDDTERLVISYAVAMSRTPPEVTDPLVASLRERLSDAQLVELTALVALENQRSRTNAALGLTSQGMKEFCELTVPATRQPPGDDRRPTA